MNCKTHNCIVPVFENDLCIFHCPKDDWFDIVENKKDWSKSQDKVEQFWKILFSKYQVDDTGYRGYIFPVFLETSFLRSPSIKKFKYGVSLEKTVFLDDAIFNACDFDDIVFLDNSKFLGKLEFESVTFDRLEANYILLTNSLSCLNVTFNEKAFFNILSAQKIKISMIGIKVIKDIELKLYDHQLKQIFDAVADIATCNNYKPIKNPPLSEFNFTGEVKDKVSCKFSFADSKIDQVLISNHNSGLFVCEQFSIQKTLILDHFINFGKAIFLNVNAENAKNISIRSSVFGDTFFEYVKWGNTSRFKCGRDEFRQLKNAYDKQANYIEANKFYASEMEAYSNEMEAKRWKSLRIWPEYLLFLFGKYSSSHGQNWLLAFGCIVVWSLIMFGLHQEAKLNFDVIINFSHYSFDWNAFARFANPFRLDLKCDEKAFISLLHKIFSGFLIYHFIIALRRNTKR